jgi:hypothetical protein
MRRSFFIALLLLTLLPAASAHAIAWLSADGSCGADGKVTFHWHYDEPGGPVAAPDWTGYDVYRRNASTCSDWVRINADPYARLAAPHDYTYEETPPDLSVVWEYQVRMVDGARQETFVLPCDCASRFVWTSCPPASPAITKGRLVDWGWTWAITPCLGSCLPSAYLAGPLPPELAPYVGGNQVIDFYGSLGCGSVEGCAIQVDHWQLAATCDITPVSRATWGRVKVLYR